MYLYGFCLRRRTRIYPLKSLGKGTFSCLLGVDGRVVLYKKEPFLLRHRKKEANIQYTLYSNSNRQLSLYVKCSFMLRTYVLFLIEIYYALISMSRVFADVQRVEIRFNEWTNLVFSCSIIISGFKLKYVHTSIEFIEEYTSFQVRSVKDIQIASKTKII